MPVPSPPPPSPPVIIRPYAPPGHDWLAGHRGLDLRAEPGQPVRALVAGTVMFAGPVGGKPVVSVRRADGSRVTYEPVDALVTVGEEVSAGDVLGTLRAIGGHCGGEAGCLHVGHRRGDAYLDPTGLVAARPAVLKPR